MFCPNCGTKNEIQQSFCRACGMELKDVLQCLSKDEGFRFIDSEWLKKLGVFTLGGFAALMICLSIVAVFSSLLIDIAFALIFLMVLFGIGLGFWAVSLFQVYQLKKENYHLRKTMRGQRDDESNSSVSQIEQWKTNKKLPKPAFEPIPSVTEETTELFYVEKLKPRTSGELY